MAELKEAAAEYQVLSKEWSKGAKMDKGKVAAMLEKLKLMLLKLSFIPTKSDEANMKELLLSRDTLEIGAQYAVMQVSSFEPLCIELVSQFKQLFFRKIFLGSSDTWPSCRPITTIIRSVITDQSLRTMN